MKEELVNLAWGTVIGIALMSIVLHLAGCAGSSGTAEARVHSALDVLADVIDPASELASRACREQQLLAATGAETGAISADQATAVVSRVRSRCRALEQVFSQLRLRHQQAVDFAASGKLEQARQQLEEIRATWRGIEGGST